MLSLFKYFLESLFFVVYMDMMKTEKYTNTRISGFLGSFDFYTMRRQLLLELIITESRE